MFTAMRFLSMLFILLPGFGYTQSLDCFQGSVTLTSGEPVRGCLLVNQLHDVVIFREGNRELVYPAHKVRRVQYLDTEKQATREFVSVLQKRNSARYHALYETVLSGTITVLRDHYFRNVSLHQEVEGYRYYICFGDEVLPLHKFRSLVYRGLAGSSPEIEDFVTRNRLDIKFSTDFIKVVDFCNQAFARAELGRKLRF